MSSAKPVGELPIFRSLTRITKTIYEVVLTIQRDAKQTFGNELLRKAILSTSLIRKAHETTDKVAKHSYICELEGEVRDIDLILKMMFECKIVPPKKLANIMLLMGELFNQLTAWSQKYKPMASE